MTHPGNIPPNATPQAYVDPMAGFAPKTYDDWRALVERDLKGADFDAKLLHHTPDGIALAPLYTQLDISQIPPRSVLEAGTAIPPTIVTSHPTAHAKQSLAHVNAAILEDLAGGAGGVVLDMGALGVNDARTLAQLLNGVHANMIVTHFAPSAHWADHARWFADVVADAAACDVGFGVDPILGAPARRTGDKHMVREVRAALALRVRRPLRVSAYHVHETGGTTAQELAAALSATAAYVRAGDDAQVPARLEWFVALNADLFDGICKLRAARRLWQRLLAQLGCADTTPLHLTTLASQRMHSGDDYAQHMLRNTVAGFAAMVGGAQGCVLPPHPTVDVKQEAFARRMARNTQLILAQEANLARVADLGGGSYYIERRTEDLVNVAWALFEEMEAKGGSL